MFSDKDIIGSVNSNLSIEDIKFQIKFTPNTLHETEFAHEVLELPPLVLYFVFFIIYLPIYIL